jgi:deoxyribodipyrimidine photo-lyase
LGASGCRAIAQAIHLKTSIHWFRRDFRLTDNASLSAAAHAAEHVVPVYILSMWKQKHHWTGPNRQEFLCGCLRALAADLQAIGGRLIIRAGDAEEELEKLLIETKAEAIHCQRDPDPFGRALEQKVAAMARKRGVAFQAHPGVAMHERDEVLTGAGEPYRVYSPYAKAWEKLPKPPPGPRVRQLTTPAEVPSLPLPELSRWGLRSEGTSISAPGEAAARQRLATFLSDAGGIGRYAAERNIPHGATTSRFSQDLRWGLLSIREIYGRCQALLLEVDAKGRDSLLKFGRELAWREFYLQILHHYPDVLRDDFNPATRGLPWRTAADEPAAFARWCEGKTGFPMVDAGMRQLARLGFMHNRLRMITAMFLTKDLRIHWRDGEAFFMRKLVDGEIANNNGGWQWSAGTGADAAPYFRIQNPWTQGRRFDPQGEFIKEFVPELRAVPAEALHQPPAPGAQLAADYPPPTLDHAAARDETLDMFRARKGGSRCL